MVNGKSSYPLVNIQKTIEHGHLIIVYNSGFTQQNGDF